MNLDESTAVGASSVQGYPASYDTLAVSGAGLPPGEGHQVLPGTFLGRFFERRGFSQCRLLDDFAASRPSASSPLTTQTYLTEVSRYMVDWLYRGFAKLPRRFQPMLNAARILHAHREADRNLSAADDTPLMRARIAKELDAKWDGKWESAAIQNKAGDEELVSLGLRSGPKQQLLPPSGIAQGDHAMLRWLLTEYRPLLDADFWKSCLSNRTIGKLMEYYRNGDEADGRKGVSSATICLRMIAIQLFREFIAEELKINFGEKPLSFPRLGQKVETVLEIEEMEAIAKHLNQKVQKEGDYRSYQTSLLFEIAYTTGIRTSALLKLTPRDLNKRRGTITIKEKNDKTREMPLFSATFEKIDKFLRLRSEILQNRNKSDGIDAPLFHSVRGNKLTRFRLYEIFSAMCKEAKLEKNEGFHTLRRSVACAMYDRGAPLHAIQQFLGHKSPRTTLSYLAHGAKNNAESILAYHPMSPRLPRSLRATACRLEKPLTVKPPESLTGELTDFRVRSDSSVRHENPGYLEDLSSRAAEGVSLLTRFNVLKATNTASTKKQYQAGVQHFMMDRLHKLELPAKYEPLLCNIVAHYLADRLDWLVRTGELSAGDGERLFCEIERFRFSEKVSLSSHFPSNDMAASILIKGLKNKQHHGGISIELPHILQLERSSKIRGIREQQLIKGIFSFQECMDQGFWREIFNREKVGQTFESQMIFGVRKGTIEKEKSALRAFGEFLRDPCGITDEKGESLVRLDGSSGKDTRPQKHLSQMEVQRIFSVLNEECETMTGREKRRALRDRAILALLYTTAARGQAVAGIKIGDLDFKRHTVYLREKGGRDATLPLLPPVEKAVLQYLSNENDATEKGIGRRGDVEVFSTFLDGRMDVKTIERILNRVGEAAGVEVRLRGNTNLSAHVFRRSAAIHMANNGAALAELQRLLGHKDIATTALYVSYGEIDQRKFVETYLPSLVA